jgi:hypothetical protein
MERLLLFIFAIVTGICLYAGVSAFATDRRAAGLYLLGAVFALGLAWRSWRRLRGAAPDARFGEKP